MLPTPKATDGHNSSPGDLRRNQVPLRAVAGLLLPTPTTAPTTGNGHARNLGTEAKRLLPTPTATPYGTNQSPSSGAAVRPSLDGIARLLPTPTASDSKASGGNTPINQTLTDILVRTQMGTQPNPRLLPTPKATDGVKGGPNQRGSKGDLTLPSVAATLPDGRSTPPPSPAGNE